MTATNAFALGVLLFAAEEFILKKQNRLSAVEIKELLPDDPCEILGTSGSYDQEDV